MGRKKKRLVDKVKDFFSEEPIIVDYDIKEVKDSNEDTIESVDDSIIVGSTVIVNGVGNTASSGTGSTTKKYTNKNCTVLFIKDDEYSYALYDSKDVFIGWFKESDITKK